MALVESHPLAYQIEELLYKLRDHIIGLNIGRWDYMASLIHFNLSDPNWVLPDGFLGNFGRTLLLAAATISAFGFVTSDILSSPGIIFAYGRDAVIPKWFAHIHPRFHTPDVAIVTYSVVAFLLSFSSTFQQLAVLSNVAVLLLYLLCFVAALELNRRNVRSDGVPFHFRGAMIVPILAIIVILWILAHATLREFGINVAVLAVASVLFLVRRLTVKKQF